MLCLLTVLLFVSTVRYKSLKVCIEEELNISLNMNGTQYGLSALNTILQKVEV